MIKRKWYKISWLIDSSDREVWQKLKGQVRFEYAEDQQHAEALTRCLGFGRAFHCELADEEEVPALLRLQAEEDELVYEIKQLNQTRKDKAAFPALCQSIEEKKKEVERLRQYQ